MGKVKHLKSLHADWDKDSARFGGQEGQLFWPVLSMALSLLLNLNALQNPIESHPVSEATRSRSITIARRPSGLLVIAERWEGLHEVWRE